MIEERAIVVNADGHQAWVETQRRSACKACSSPCGTALTAATVRPIRLRVTTTVPLQAGDEVVIGIGESVLLAGSALAYLMPIVLLLIGAVLGTWIGPGDAYSLLGGSIGLLMGFVFIASCHRHQATQPHWQPVVLRRVETENEYDSRPSEHLSASVASGPSPFASHPPSYPSSQSVHRS